MDDLRGGGSVGGRGRVGRLLPVAVLITLVVASLGVFLIVRRAVDDQNGRILKERTGEVGLLLQTAVGELPASMQQLGVAERLGGAAAFLREADAQTAAAKTETIALVRRVDGKLTVVAASGLPILAKGDTLVGAPATAVGAGMGSGKLVATPLFRVGPALGRPSPVGACPDGRAAEWAGGSG